MFYFLTIYWSIIQKYHYVHTILTRASERADRYISLKYGQYKTLNSVPSKEGALKTRLYGNRPKIKLFLSKCKFPPRWPTATRRYKGRRRKVGCTESKRRASGTMRPAPPVLLFLCWIASSGGRTLHRI